MTKAQSAAYIMCRAVEVQGIIESMVAENKDREQRGLSIAYSEQSFLKAVEPLADNLITKIIVEATDE